VEQAGHVAVGHAATLSQSRVDGLSELEVSTRTAVVVPFLGRIDSDLD
jgi:hypothetical protein